jgi:SAM-dependent methyltransferase
VADRKTPAQPLSVDTARRTPPPDLPEASPAEDDAYRGATPSDFFSADPTPPPPSGGQTADEKGAAPVETAASATGGESELSEDVVELIPSVTDENELSARPAIGSSLKTTIPDLPSAAPIVVDASHLPIPTEPREVEPEALEELESTEHATASGPEAASAPTPPPVPAELAARLPSRAPEPPNPTARPQEPPSPPTRTQATPSSARSTENVASVPAPPHRQDAAALFEEFQTPLAGGEAIPEALARRSLKKRSKPWYEEVFDEDYLRTLPFMTPEQTAREVGFIRSALSIPPGGEVLDVGCGYGRHALELAQDGLHVTGLDLSLPLLIRAADHAQKRGLSVNFVHADMREMTFNGQFDAAYCVLSTFGYFDEETNLRVANAICKSLKPGGKFLLDILNRDYIVGDLPSRVWWEGDGCVVLEEVDFNYHTSRVLIRRSVVFGNGRQTEQELSMRAYSLHEVGKLLRQAGLRVLDVSGGLATKSRFFGAASRNIIAVCERPTP